MRSPPLAAVALGLAALGPLPASAADFEVQAATGLQGYQVTDPWGNTLVERRRFTQTVGLALYNLQGAYRPGEASYGVVLMMRLNGDYGINARLPSAQAGGETSYSTSDGDGVRFVPGLEQNPVDLMYGYVEGKNLAHGLFGFRLGRQYMTDVLGWWSFDGALLRVTTPFFVQLEMYGGLEQRGGLPLSAARFERRGVWRGSHTGFGVGAHLPSVADYPSYLYAEPAPAFGFALESTGPTWLHGRLSYRRVYNTGAVLTAELPEPRGAFDSRSGTRVSQDRIGCSAEVTKRELGAVKAGASYDLYSQLFATAYGGLEAYIGKRATVGADIDYFVPTFDADSIWNFFTHGPITTVSTRVAARITRRLDVAASGGTRLWTADGDPTPSKGGLSEFGAGECAAAQSRLAKVGATLDCAMGHVYVDPTTVTAYTRDPKNRGTTVTADALADVSGRYRLGSAELSMRGTLQTGARGSRAGADLAGETRFDGGRYTVGTRMSLYGSSDPTRPDRDAVSFGYVLAAGYKPASLARFRLEWEHDMSRLVGQRYRVVALVNLLVVK